MPRLIFLLFHTFPLTRCASQEATPALTRPGEEAGETTQSARFFTSFLSLSRAMPQKERSMPKKERRRYPPCRRRNRRRQPAYVAAATRKHLPASKARPHHKPDSRQKGRGIVLPPRFANSFVCRRSARARQRPGFRAAANVR